MNKYRHGDICLEQVESIPDNAKRSDSKVILAEGSGGNPHGITDGELFFVENEFPVIGYLKAESTKLTHAEHGEEVLPDGLKAAAIEDGIYKITRQQEETHEGMKPVVD